MYSEPGLVLPFLPGFSQEFQPAHHYVPLPGDELLHRFVAPHMGNLAETTLKEYDLGGEDIFKFPNCATQELVFDHDPMAAAISMVSSNEDLITTENIKSGDMKSMQNELLNGMFCDCKDLLENNTIKGPASMLSDVNNLASMQMEKSQVVKGDRLVHEGPLQKSVSSECLRSLINSCNVGPNFLNFQGLDLGDEFGIRRACSEGDIQTLGRKNSCLGTTSIVHSSVNISDLKIDNKIEDRRQKLCRYMKKKSKRNFSRKIKYACRKALADSQPRVRGRFAKTGECDAPKPYQENKNIMKQGSG
ncbi:hypothetical protein J5N97_007783 [Dioscorea zingiberensis]|uniref:CCT domain-containing protein n=1 Tax=Dioscorea zingiberensis TaxID=325984 RepID=A0A9D5DG32_9LILI|nr:hypothetical protein J5N97_007783 [Dioscorea zingiberensis]